MKRLLVALALVSLSVSYVLADDAGVGSGSSSTGSASAVGSDSGSSVGSGSAIAVVPVVVIDPAHPVQTVEDAWAAEKQFGFIWGSMLVLFGIGTIIIKKNDETHWLNTDHYLPVGVGILGTLGAVLSAKFAGGSWNVVLSTLMATVALVLQKPAPGKNVDGTPKVKTPAPA